MNSGSRRIVGPNLSNELFIDGARISAKDMRIAQESNDSYILSVPLANENARIILRSHRLGGPDNAAIAAILSLPFAVSDWLKADPANKPELAVGLMRQTVPSYKVGEVYMHTYLGLKDTALGTAWALANYNRPQPKPLSDEDLYKMGWCSPRPTQDRLPVLEVNARRTFTSAFTAMTKPVRQVKRVLSLSFLRQKKAEFLARRDR